MKRLLALAAFQVLVLLGWAAQNEYVRATAPTFRIPLQPRDPFDVLRGRYFILNPKDGSVKAGADGILLTASEVKRFLSGRDSFAGVALVCFCPHGDSYRVCRLAETGAKLSDEEARYWSNARHVSITWEDVIWRNGGSVKEPGYRVEIDLALDRFFLPSRVVLPGRENAEGWEVEVCHRPGQTPLPRRLFFNGKAALAE